MIPLLPEIVIDPIVRLALAEDLGRAGDLTTDALISNQHVMAQIVTREAGRLAGQAPAIYAMKLVDAAVEIGQFYDDGHPLTKGDTVLTFQGPARSILMAERTMLNFMGRACGVASHVSAYVAAVAPFKAQVVCTRKTMPGHRALDKHAVRCGGASVHRYGLDDAILIKDNHIAAVGSIPIAMERAHAYAGHLRMIEIEVDTLEQLQEVLDCPFAPHVVLLDNMPPETLKKAVAMVDGRFKTEASGGVNLDTIADIAASGVDYISVGALTHSAPNFDLGMDF